MPAHSRLLELAVDTQRSRRQRNNGVLQARSRLQQRAPDPGLDGIDRDAVLFRELLSAFAADVGGNDEMAPRWIERLQRVQNIELMHRRVDLVLRIPMASRAVGWEASACQIDSAWRTRVMSVIE